MKHGSSQNPFLAEVQEAFAKPLESGRLKVVEERYDPAAFGNAVVVLEGKAFRFRVVRDRDVPLFDMASLQAPNEWYVFKRVIEAVGGRPEGDEGPLSLADAAELLTHYGDALERGLGTGWAETKPVVERLDKAFEAMLLRKLERRR
jgi:hypothetical protein